MKSLFQQNRMIYDAPANNPETASEKPEAQAEKVPLTAEQARQRVLDESRAQRAQFQREITPPADSSTSTQKSEAVPSSPSTSTETPSTPETPSAPEVQTSSAESSTATHPPDTTSATSTETTAQTAETAPASTAEATTEAPKKGIMDAIGLLVQNFQLIFDKFKSGELKIADIPDLLDPEKLEQIVKNGQVIDPEVKRLAEACTKNFALSKVNLNGKSLQEVFDLSETLTPDELLGLMAKQSNPCAFQKSDFDTKQLQAGDIVFVKSGSAESDTTSPRISKVAIITENGSNGPKIRYIQGGEGEQLLSESPDKNNLFGYMQLSATLRTGVVALRAEQAS